MLMKMIQQEEDKRPTLALLRRELKNKKSKRTISRFEKDR